MDGKRANVRMVVSLTLEWLFRVVFFFHNSRRSVDFSDQLFMVRLAGSSDVKAGCQSSRNRFAVFSLEVSAQNAIRVGTVTLLLRPTKTLKS